MLIYHLFWHSASSCSSFTGGGGGAAAASGPIQQVNPSNKHLFQHSLAVKHPRSSLPLTLRY